VRHAIREVSRDGPRSPLEALLNKYVIRDFLRPLPTDHWQPATVRCFPMDPTLAAVLSSWTLDGWLVISLLATAAIYLRGWLVLRRRGAERFDARHLAMFLGGLAAIYLALGSPIDTFAGLLLQLHMVQHLLLIIVAAPLVWLAAPQLPLLIGLPAAIREVWIEPLARTAWLRRALTRATQPAAAWTLYVSTLWLWHIPQMYEAALASTAWHYGEHACFFGTGLLFWWPVLSPYPSRTTNGRWYVLPYLFLAGVQGTVLSAILTFSDRVLYPHYELVPRLWGLSALDDQAIAGAIMWIPGSLAYLIPLALVGSELLYGPRRARIHKPETRSWDRIRLPSVARFDVVLASQTASGWHVPERIEGRGACQTTPFVPQGVPPLKAARFDLLSVPLVGSFLRWRNARIALQLPMLAVAAVVILDGFLGPQVAPLNLAGVLPWIHWRGLLVLALLTAGNVFCMACPFTAARGIARRLLGGDRHWPRWLRNKWLAVALLAFFFWAYEAFAIWDSPWWTAWIAVAYFLTAFVVEGLFQGAAFCKYVCPIGQFNFVQSLVSPWEVRVRQPDVCHTCATKDCIRGRDRIEGCGLELFQPRKAGNMDCTFCLDCARACPHANVGVLSVAPGAALLGDEDRSGVGRYSRRADLAALVVVLVSSAFVNAAGMVAPVLEFEDRLTAALGLASRLPVMTCALLLGIVVAPAMLISSAALASRWLGSGWMPGRGVDRRVSVRTGALRFSYSLVPIGCGMWLAHYGFHLITSADSIVPAVCRAAADMGIGEATSAAKASCCSAKAADWLLRLEITFLDVGLLGSLYVAYRTARELWPAPARSLSALAPWAALIVLLFAAGVWIIFQPMEMRGAVARGM
jgi:cytochrome c oxidase assembly factor CtaG